MATCREKIRLVIADNTIGEDKVVDLTPETHVQDDLGADSLTVTEIIMQIEEVVDFEIPDDDAKELVTVGQIEEYLERKGVDLDAAA